ncbi:hypothetical protein M409DRAFT_28168 [Zasmidium cellare ATCC 36951]|uniref:Uncharacterized protein n=1 Tax=Zasmidium cellare ATCC 36951 TaxID=1080233 RepID=A0A6A6C5A0_ZASCE|nr:uncharacterized protein M409DRAFT_28168 [Zasmidium cellare ATCC 36951]KAF2161438.1 hypothetical protein M409DRAFT_28168 [Zasmidium cellare ATCC 36951]
MKYHSIFLPLLPITVTALFSCNEDQNAFPARAGKFVVHYTSVRDENLDGQPWIRICLPSPNGDFTDVSPLNVPCNEGPPVRFPYDQTKLEHTLIVTNGNGCDEDSSNLDGARMEYDGQKRDLSGEDEGCGKRSHGISCEFTL